MDQSSSGGIRRQKTATVIFDSQCPKVVDKNFMFLFPCFHYCIFIHRNRIKVLIFWDNRYKNKMRELGAKNIEKIL